MDMTEEGLKNYADLLAALPKPKPPVVKPAWYPSPISLAEGTSGKVHVRHRIITGSTPIIGDRQAIVRGMRPVTAKLTEPLKVHELSSEGVGVWMTDLPEELNQIAEMLAEVKPFGHVLIGGLGLGIVAAIIAQREDTYSTTVVERSADVIKLCRSAALDYKVVKRDIRQFLRETKRDFDFYLLDTWQATSESAWWSQVFPLKRIIRNRHGLGPTVHCWAEDIMAGQIIKTVVLGNRSWFYEGLPAKMTVEAVQHFIRDVGSPEWEERYGRLYPIKGRMRG